MPIRIGVLSDTHIPGRARTLPPVVFAGLQGVDMLLHAGDITRLDVLGELAAIAPVQAVHGNMDPLLVRQQLPHKLVVQVGSHRIGLIHGDGTGLSTPERVYRIFSKEQVDAAVFGHSHQPYNERRQGLLLFNPGSPTDRRFCPQFSYGILTITENGITGEIVYF